MRSLSALSFRNLWARKARTLLTTGGIVLGVALILATSIATHSAEVSVRQLFEEAAGRASLVVTSDSPAEGGFSEQALRRVQDTPGVAAAAPLVQTVTLLAEDADQVSLVSFVLELSGGLLLCGVDPDLDPQVHTVRIVEGRFFASREDKDKQVIVLTRDYAQEKGLAVGDDVELLIAEGTESFEIVGLMAKEGLGLFHRGKIGLLPLRTLQRVFERGRELDQIDVVAAPGADTEQLKADLQATLGRRYAVTYSAARGKLIEQMIARYTQGMNLSSTMALFVGAFLIYNTFSMTVLERTRELGLLRALGATRGRVLRLLLAEALLKGAIGSTLGVILGLSLAYSLRDVLAAYSNVEVVAFQVPSEGLFLALGVGMMVTVLAALRPVWRASRLPPVEALRPRAVAGEGGVTPRRTWFGLGVMVLASVALFLPMDKTLRVPVLYVSVLALLGGAAFLSPVLVRPLEQMLRPLIRLAPGASIQEVRQRIKERFGKRYHLQVETQEEFQERVLAYAEETLRYLDLFVLIGLTIAALGVLNTLLVNVLERVREIGILRGLGMTRGQVIKMILAEAGVMGEIGALLGLLLGIYLSRSFMDVSNALTGYQWSYVFPGQAVVTGLVAVLLTAFLAALYPAWRAAWLDVVNAIRQE